MKNIRLLQEKTVNNIIIFTLVAEIAFFYLLKTPLTASLLLLLTSLVFLTYLKPSLFIAAGLLVFLVSFFMFIFEKTETAERFTDYSFGLFFIGAILLLITHFWIDRKKWQIKTINFYFFKISANILAILFIIIGFFTLPVFLETIQKIKKIKVKGYEELHYISDKKDAYKNIGFLSNKIVGQTFKAKKNNLNQVNVVMTLLDINKLDGEIVFHLGEGAKFNKDIRTVRVPMKDIREYYEQSFRFEKIEKSNKKNYYFYIEAGDKNSGENIIILYNQKGRYKNGKMYLLDFTNNKDLNELSRAGKKENWDLRFKEYYEPSFLNILEYLP